MNGWLLDTNIVSEVARPRPNAAVASWLSAQPLGRLFISVLTIGEILQGIWKLPEAAPARPRFEAMLAGLEARFRGRMLNLSDPVVRRWGRLSGLELAAGRTPPVVDILLAATALEHRLYLATRNVRDVRATGAAVFDPWTDDPARFPLSA